MAGSRRAVLWRKYASFVRAFALLFGCLVAMLLLLSIPVTPGPEVMARVATIVPEYALVTLIAAGASLAATRRKRIKGYFAKKLALFGSIPKSPVRQP